MKSKILIISLIALIAAGCTKHEFRTEQIAYNNTTILPDSPADSLVISIDIEFPIDIENPKVLPLIQQDLLATLLDEEVHTTDGQSAVEEYAKHFEQGYLEAFSADHNDSIGIDCWENIITGRVMSIQNNILAYCDERYVFSGGPHGVNSRHFYNYDLKTGKYLTENDIFKEGFEPILTGLLIDNLIDQYEEFESIEDIIQSDFSIENIKPNNNFYFTEDELVYVFNVFEIASYYRGETEISIPITQVQDLLK